jgi:hypothetical protein
MDAQGESVWGIESREFHDGLSTKENPVEERTGNINEISVSQSYP